MLAMNYEGILRKVFMHSTQQSKCLTSVNIHGVCGLQQSNRRSSQPITAKGVFRVAYQHTFLSLPEHTVVGMQENAPLLP